MHFLSAAFPKRTLLLVSIALLQPSIVFADSSLTEHQGPRELSLGGSMRANAQGRMAITLNPAGLSLDRKLVFEGTYGHRSDNNAKVVSISACDSTVGVPACLYYNFLSTEAMASALDGIPVGKRTVHQFGIVTSRAITENVLFGTNSKYFDYDSSDESESASGFGLDAGIILRAGQTANLAVVGYNLIAKNTPQYPRAFGTGIALYPVEGFGIAADALWDVETEGAKGRYSGGLEYLFRMGGGQTGLPFRAGAVRDQTFGNTYVTGGIGYNTLRLAVDVGVQKQIGGTGDDLMIQAGLRLFDVPGVQ